MGKYTLGVLSDPNHTQALDANSTQTLRRALGKILDAYLEAQRREGSGVTLAVVAGPEDHPVSRVVYEEAQRRDLPHRPSTEWGREGSAFYQDCEVLVQLSPDEGPWCLEQAVAYRRFKPGHMLLILLDS